MRPSARKTILMGGERVTGSLDGYAGLIFLLHPQVKSLDYKNHRSQQKEDSKDSAEAKVTQATKWQEYANDKEALPPKSKTAWSSSAVLFNHYLEILKKKSLHFLNRKIYVTPLSSICYILILNLLVQLRLSDIHQRLFKLSVQNKFLLTVIFYRLNQLWWVNEMLKYLFILNTFVCWH